MMKYESIKDACIDFLNSDVFDYATTDEQREAIAWWMFRNQTSPEEAASSVLGLSGSDRRELRVKDDWEKIAGEILSIIQISGGLYAFGSELATLRLLAKYRKSDKARAGYSENLKTHYFVLDLLV